MNDGVFLGGGDVDDALAACGIVAGDLVFLHCQAPVSALFAAMEPEARFDMVIEAVLARIGRIGTLVMPTFTHSFARSEPFDVRQSPSTAEPITEHFRKRPGVLRSCNPMVSVAAVGRFAHVFAGSKPTDCFGRDTAFAKLYQLNGKICCIGCPLDHAAFVHYVEQRCEVDYRHLEKFKGTVIGVDGRRRQMTTRYFASNNGRDAEVDLSRLRSRLLDDGKLSVAAIGGAEVVAVRAQDFFDTAKAMLDADPRSLIRAGRAQRAA